MEPGFIVLIVVSVWVVLFIAFLAGIAYLVTRKRNNDVTVDMLLQEHERFKNLHDGNKFESYYNQATEEVRQEFLKKSGMQQV